MEKRIISLFLVSDRKATESLFIFLSIFFFVNSFGA